MTAHGKNAASRAATKKAKNARERQRRVMKTAQEQRAQPSTCKEDATPPRCNGDATKTCFRTTTTGTKLATTYPISEERAPMPYSFTPCQAPVTPLSAQDSALEIVEQEVAPCVPQNVEETKVNADAEPLALKVILEVSGPTQKVNLMLIYNHNCAMVDTQHDAAPRADSSIPASAESTTILEQSEQGALDSPSLPIKANLSYNFPINANLCPDFPINANLSHDFPINIDRDNYLDVCDDDSNMASCHLLSSERACLLSHMPQAPVQTAVEPKNACDPVEKVTSCSKKVTVGGLFVGIAKAAASAASLACMTSFYMGAAVPIAAATVVLEVSASALSLVTPKRSAGSDSKLTEGAVLSSTAATMEPITESPAEPELAPAMEVQALAEDGELQAETFSFQHGFFPEPDLFSGPGFFQADFDIDAGNMWSNNMTAKNSFAQAAASKHAQIDLALSKDASKCCKPISDFKISAYVPAAGETIAQRLPTWDSAADMSADVERHFEDGALDTALAKDSQMLSSLPATEEQAGDSVASLQPAPAATKTLAGMVMKAAGAAARLAMTAIYLMVMSPVVVTSVAIDLAVAAVKHTAATLCS